MEPKGRLLTPEELYVQEYYDDRIKPRINAEKEAGNVTMPGEFLSMKRRVTKQLLEEEDNDVKQKIQEMYVLQKTNPKDEDLALTDPTALQK